MIRPRARVVLTVVSTLLSSALLGGACGEKKGGLMLAVTTDMKAPKDVNAVSISISVNGALKHSFIGRVTPQGEVLLPATLAIAEPDDSSATVRIRVMAFQDRRPRVLRDVRTTIPGNGRVATLPIRLAFVNLDRSTKSGPAPEGVVPPPLPGTGGPNEGAPTTGVSAGTPDFDFFTAFAPDCPDIEHQTFIDGECRDSYLDSASLPDFDPSQVAATNTDPTTCFDVAKCFMDASEVSELDRTTCSVPLGAADPALINFAFVTVDTGECVKAGECYVPIDRGSAGWTAQDGRARLPAFVCRLVGNGVRLYQTSGRCDAKQESSPICAAKPGDVALPQASLSGTMIDTYHPGDTAPTVARPHDLTHDITLELLAPRADGSFSDAKPIAGLADGTFSISFVPEAAGPVYVHVRTAAQNYYVVTASKMLALGAEFQGRPDAQSATPGTSVNLALDGLSPTADGDLFHVTSVGAAESLEATTSQVDATSLDVAFDGNGHNLVDGTKGDVAYVLQTNEISVPIPPYQLATVTTFAMVPAFTEVSGVTTTVPSSGRLTMRAFTTAETATVTFDWRRSQFQALRTDIHPLASARLQFTGVYGEPFGGATYGISYADLAVVHSGSEANDIKTGEVTYGFPFPKSWGPLAFARSRFFVSVTAPGAKPTDLDAFIEAYMPVPASGVIDARPYVGPARNIRIDGMPALEVPSVSISPRVEWDTPAIGTPNMYVLDVVRLDNTAGETTTTVATSIFTAERQVRIPAGVMEVGKTYLLRVITARDERPDAIAAPQHFSIPFGRARTLTNPFSVRAP